jgi:predicted outer membrane repeat protein
VQEAIDAASSGETITICPGTYSGTITIGKSLTLIGAGDGDNPAVDTILQAAMHSTTVTILSGSGTFQNLRITGGSSSGPGGGIFDDSSSGTLTMTDCSVSNNTAAGDGGGIFHNGQMTLIRCTVTANEATSATAFGGGIYHSGNATLDTSSVSSNTAGGNGGGTRNADSFSTLSLINGSSVTNNHAGGQGGGIHNPGTVACSGGSTVSGNTQGTLPVTSDCVDAGTGTGCATCPV